MPRLKEVTPRVRVGSGVERQNLTVFPLFAEDGVQPARYVPVGGAIRTGSARVTEVSEGGSVPTLALENLTDIPVLILDGEELLGARQNRISNLSVLAPGKKTLRLDVSCVERGRWSYRSREFAESPDIMFHSARARKARAVSLNLAADGSRDGDQGAVWGDIDSLSSKLGCNSPTSAMQDVYQSRRASIDEYLQGVGVADGQVGAIFAINGVAAGLELFDSTETLRTYLPKILRSYALDALANQTASPAKAEDADGARFLDSILELDAKSFPAVGLGQDLRLDARDITGGALTHEGRVIHLAAFRTSLPEPSRRHGHPGNSTLPLIIRQGHMLLGDGHGRLALLDTGSPVSIGRGNQFNVAGQSFNPSSGMQSVLDTAGEHIRHDVEWLLGHDFFAENRVVIDWPGGQAHVLGRNPAPNGVAIPLEVVMDVPVVTGRSGGGPLRAVIDSGASLSYVPAEVVQGLTPVGERSDFYPGFGEFETAVWSVRTEIGGRTMTIAAGILPPMLRTMFGLILGPDGWIIGSDFFRDRVMVIDYPARCFVDLTAV